MEAWRRNTYSSQTHHIIHSFSCSEENKLSLSQTVENHQHKANIFGGNFCYVLLYSHSCGETIYFPNILSRVDDTDSNHKALMALFL